MHGRTRAVATSQALILSELFRSSGYSVVTASDVANRYLRLLDIIATVLRTRRDVDVQCLEIYGGPSFVVEDIASWLGKMAGHRIVMTLHGGAMPEFMARFPKWTRRVLGRADVLLSPSPYLQRAAAEHGFAAQLIPNVLDLRQYPFRPRSVLKPRLFWMRSFHDIWNPLMAVRVLRRVREVVPDATLVMAGQDKGQLEETTRLATDLGLGDAITFPGFLDAGGKKGHGDAADIFITTNRIDNMPVAILEACAMGLPVVSTNVGGVPDLLEHERTGLLTPDDDDAAMADAVLRLLSDPELSSRLARNGRQLAERSSWEVIRPLWDAAFDRVLATAGTRLQHSNALS
jgi:glycosyltransferase involved in cell wall biosynthesis